MLFLNTENSRYSLVEHAGEDQADRIEWFRSEIARARMRALMQRSDGPALLNTSIWLGLMLASAVAVCVLWDTWWCVPFVFIYGVLYGSGAEPRRHETSHGTPFRTRWLNTVTYQIASFLTMREPTVNRWQHTRHHTETMYPGRDPEIEVMRPARLARILSNFIGLTHTPESLTAVVVHSAGRLAAEERTFVPESERHKVYRTSRIWLLIYLAAIAACFLTRSFLPVVLIGGPRIYGCFMEQVYGLTQHGGMGENVADHRLNTRTIHMNVVNRFLYWNMGYHMEHHMFPMVPCFRLGELHAEISRDLAPAYPSLWAAYREMIPAVLRQLKDQTYYIRRELPPGAAPYLEMTAAAE